jgi:ferrochelatase
VRDVKSGLLLVNLGTPDAPTTPAVRRYLAEFLSDPRVIDINPVGRWLLLHAIILRTRPKKSAEAYRKVWTERGSPLLFHSQDLAQNVAERLGPGWHVELGMRYGSPSLPDALARLEAAAVERIVVFPLYPQYASSSTGSTLERLYALAAERPVVPALGVVGDCYDAPGFLDAVTAVANDELAGFGADHVLFSFHGLPERQVKATDFGDERCLSSATCCDAMTPDNRSCYRAQSFATARGLAARMGLAADGWTVGFQSRLGRTPWIKPYTDELLITLAQRGVRRLAVLCPSFVADCLETLEEIGMRARESFIGAGGEDLLAIPCVNSHPLWVDLVADLARRALPPAV